MQTPFMPLTGSAYMGAISTGDCIVQAPMGFSTNQLMKMVVEFGLNTLMLYAPFAATHIMQGRERPDVLKALQSMRGVLYTGVALEPQIQDWAYEHNLPLQVSTTSSLAWWRDADKAFRASTGPASAVCLTPLLDIIAADTTVPGPMMRTTKGPGPNHYLLRPLPGLKVQFIPLDSEAEGSGAKLFEAVVPKDSPDAPHPSFFREDGLHHTNDLFERVDGDGYLYRGRADDWVKTHLALVDTKCVCALARDAWLAHERA
jgi:acyl-coenzyme A synthetase/AMP-(fatty) acid ligase